MDLVILVSLINFIVLVLMVVLIWYWRQTTVAEKKEISNQLARLQGLLENSSSQSVNQNVQQLQLEQRQTSTLMSSVLENLNELHHKSDTLDRQLNQLQNQHSQQRILEDQAFASIRRLESIMAGGSRRGKAGENILAQILNNLPPEWREYNVKFGGKMVEFAIPLPGGKFLPVDSKWTSQRSLEKLAETNDPNERQRILRQIERDVEKKVSEMIAYLDPDRTYGFGIIAVPDAIYEVCATVHVTAYKQGVMIIGYRMAIPYLLTTLQLIRRFTNHVDAVQLHSALRTLTDNLDRMDNELEGRYTRTLTTFNNSIIEQRRLLNQSRQLIAQLYGLLDETDA